MRCVLPFIQLISRKFTRKYSSGVLKKVQYSYSFQPGNVSFVYFTLGQILDNAAADCGDTTAYVSPAQNLRKTFDEFKTEVDNLASGFLAHGLKRGDRIALCATNIYEWPLTLFAAAKAGLVLVSINPANRADEIKYCLNKVECKAIVTLNSFKTQNYYDMLCSFIPELPHSKPGMLQSEAVQALQTVILITNDSSKPKNGAFVFEDVTNGGTSESRENLNQVKDLVQCDDPFNIQFTSGTTGQPKAAILTQHSVVNNALLAGRIFGHDIQKPVVCCLVPFFHSFGCNIGLISSVLHKNTMVMPSAGYDGEESIKAIQKEKCTTVYAAPTMYFDILDKYKPEQHDLSSLHQTITGGAPCPQELLRQLRNKLNIKDIHNGYGSTETSPGIAINPKGVQLEKILTGYLTPLQNVEVKIIDSDGNIVPCGTQGEICVRGCNVFRGYWKNEEKTAEAIDEAHWYHTGDLGDMNENGDIIVNGRIKDLVIRGAENIYPAEVENFLQTHPSILEVYVCGVPDAKMGEELCAWVHMKADKTLTEEEVKEFCKGKISHYKIPRYILFVNEFPKLATGKVKKYVMTEVSKEKLGL